MAVADESVPAATPGAAPAGPLVLYDGTCGLCARSVRWILRHERDRDIRFAPLQGPTAAALREKFTNIPSEVDTVVFVDGERAHLRSKAFLYLATHLHAPWRWAYAFRWFPGPVLNVGYRIIAALRYRMFGRVDACELPSPENRVRFLP